MTKMETTIAIGLLSAAITLLGITSIMQARRITMLQDITTKLMISNIALMKTDMMLKQIAEEELTKQGGFEHGKEEPTNH